MLVSGAYEYTAIRSMTLKSSDTPTRALGSSLRMLNLPVTAQSDTPSLIVPCATSVSSVSATRSIESVSGEPTGAKR